MGLLLILAGNLWGQEMTPQKFKELVTKPGDTNALRPELASLPLWTNARCSISMTYADGRVFTEEDAQTAKTIAGKYIVFSAESKYYHQTMHSIVGYDDKASAIRQWGLFGDTLTESTMIFDPVKKINASMARYGDGFEEISVGSCSGSEMTDHAVVYKNGALFLTREVKTWQVSANPRAQTN